jgi:hypothetical protein
MSNGVHRNSAKVALATLELSEFVQAVAFAEFLEHGTAPHPPQFPNRLLNNEAL